jgi:hypothetical protein
MSQLDEALAVAFAELGVSSNGQRPAGATLPDEFWNARDAFGHIRRAAHARQCSAPYLMLATLSRVAAVIPHTLELPPTIGAPRPLCLFTAGIGPSGVGKTSAADVASEPIRIDNPLVADQLPLGSGEGLAEVLFDWVWEDDENGDKRKVKRQTRYGAFMYVDEGQMLADLGKGRKGATLLPTVRTIWTGGTIGNTNASQENRRIVPSGQYTFGIIIGLQPHLAGALLDDADAGTPQRFCWAYATDPGIPDVEPDWPGPLKWEPPSAGELEHIKVQGAYIRHRLPVHPDIVAEIREAGRARARGEVIPDPLDAHGFLARYKVGGLLATLDGHVPAGITPEDWYYAGLLKGYSDAVRHDVVAHVQRTAAEREAATTERLTNRRLHSDAAAEMRRAIDCARRIAAKVHEREWLRRDLFNDLRRWRDVFNEGLEHAIAEGWVVEHVEAGQGADKRILRPGPKRPS